MEKGPPRSCAIRDKAPTGLFLLFSRFKSSLFFLISAPLAVAAVMCCAPYEFDNCVSAHI
jgi:hypothetical protein